MAVVRGGRVMSRNKARTIVARRVSMAGGARALRASPAQFFSLGGLLKGIGKTIGGFATGGIGGAVAAAGQQLFGNDPGPMVQPAGCPPGWAVGLDGQCAPGGGLPFGPPNLPALPQNPNQLPSQPTGTAVVGAFGLPALVPDIVGTVETRTGERRLIRRCMPGLVLGKDNLCYPRQILGARGRFRKHPAAPKPPVTAADAKAIRQAASATNRVKRLATKVGFTCAKRGGARRR